jgi:hypothetical protein
MRTRICLYILLLVPLTVYWQAVFENYGIRDDYSYLRQAREEPGKIVKITASHGRPLYGALLETSYVAATQVEELIWLRLTTVLLLTLLGLVLWRQLYNSGWTEVEAAVLGLGVTLLPSAQSLAGAAMCWPHALTLLLAMAGFSAVETEVERGGMKRMVALLGGCMIYTVATLINQSNVLFAIVPIAAVFLVRSGREPLNDLKWGATHLATMLVGMLLAYLMVKGLFSNGVFEESVRMKLETNPFTKLFWFFIHPLPNALALYALADDHFNGVVFYAVLLLAVVAVLVLAYRRILAEGKAVILRKLKICLFGLPFLAAIVSLVAAERATGYRAIFALSTLVLLMLLYSIRILLEGRKTKPLYVYGGYGVLLLLFAFLAHRQTYLLVAEPQSREWSLMQSHVDRAEFTKPLKVYVVTPTAADRPTERVYGDEFGRPSSESPTVAQEMFKAAVRARYPLKQPKGLKYELTAGTAQPVAGAYDFVVDMKKLKALGGR